MSMRLTSLFALLWPVCAALCQPFSARNDHSGVSQADLSWLIIPHDSGYMIVQDGFEPFSTAIRVSFTHVSQEGVINEYRSFGVDSIGCFSGDANGPSIDSDGGFLLCGGTSDGSRDGAVFWRFDEEVDSLWSKEIYPDANDNAIGRAAREHHGKLYGAGGVWHPGNSGQMFLAALDTNGTLLWTHEYGTSVRDEAYSLDTVADGGFVIAGTHWASSADWQGYVVKVDSEGSEQWHQYLGGPYQESPIRAISSRAGKIFCAGTYAAYQQGGTTKQRLYAAQLTSDGSIEWQRQYGGQSEVNYLSSVTELHDGSFIAPGSYDDGIAVKGVLLHLAENGDSLWMRTYQHPPNAGPFGVHWLQHAIQDPNGSIVSTGIVADGEQDLWVIRVDSFGCLVPGCQLFDQVAEQGDGLHVGIYPNPASERLYITFRSGAIPQGEFTLVDAEGRIVRRFAPGGKSEEIDLDVRTQPPGSYLLTYADKQGERWAQRVVIE